MKPIKCKNFPPYGYIAITIWPFVFYREEYGTLSKCVTNHESIHLRQQAEMLVIPFYIAYLAEYLIGRAKGLNHFKAYKNISFEREAFEHEEDYEYLKKRKHFAQWR